MPTTIQPMAPAVKMTKPQPVMRGPRFEAVISAATHVAANAIHPAISDNGRPLAVRGINGRRALGLRHNWGQASNFFHRFEKGRAGSDGLATALDTGLGYATRRRINSVYRQNGTAYREVRFGPGKTKRRIAMGKGILLWLVGVPIPVILLLLLFWH